MAEKDILSAIKEDNLARFSAEWNDRTKVLSFGRFPVLSLCYLYKSRRILARYEKEFFSVDRYTVVEEDMASYRKFRTYAGKTLMLYVGGKTVTPPEMLAILGDQERLTWLYPKFYKNEKIRTSIEHIERILYGSKVTFSNNAIRIHSKKLKKGQRITVCVAACLSAVFCALCVFVMLGSFSLEKKPTDVFNEQRLLMLLNGGKDCILSKDIELTEDFSLEAYEGTLDGNGHTLTLPTMNHALIGTLSEKGTIKNLTVRIQNAIYENIDEDLAFFVRENKGTLTNVDLQLSAKISVMYRESETDEEGNVLSYPEDVYISCLVGENQGTVSECTADVVIQAQGTTGRDSYLTVFATKNYNLVADCSVSDTSTIVCDTLDVSGFVTINGDVYGSGTLQDSTFAGLVSQSTSSNKWSPNAGGFAMYNYGTVIGCECSGNVTAESTYEKQEDEELSLELHAAGIVVFNHYVVQQCICSGTVEGKSASVLVVAGGLVAMNIRSNTYDGNELTFYFIGSVVFSDSVGTVKASSSGGESCYAGGIVGYNYGTTEYFYSYISGISYCRSTATLEGGDSAYLGGLVGLNNYGSVKLCFADAAFVGAENTVCGQTVGLSDVSSVRYAVLYTSSNNYYYNSAVQNEKAPYSIGLISGVEVSEYNNVQTTAFETRAKMFDTSNPSYELYLSEEEKVNNGNQ